MNETVQAQSGAGIPTSEMTMFNFLKSVSAARGLADELASGKSVELASGDYDLDTNALTTLNVRAANPTRTRIRVHQTLRVGYWSRAQDVTFIPQGTFAAINLDLGAYSIFERVLFESPLPPQSHLGKKWHEVTHKGVGVQTTRANDGDNSYMCKFYACAFDFFEIGIDIQVPAQKGTVGWHLHENVFNGCRYAVNGGRIGDWQINYGNVQLAERGILVDGNNNRLMRVHFERGQTDIEIAAGAYYNEIDGADARPDRVIDNGVGTHIRLMPNRNIGRSAD